MRTPLLVALVFASGLTAGLWTGRAAAERVSDPYVNIDSFARVLSLIESHYVDEVQTSTLIDHAVEGMVSRLDEHSRWLDERAYREMREDTEGKYQGVGVEVREESEGLRVLRALPGGPAARAGVLAGDLITHASGSPLRARSATEASSLLRGPRGTSVVLTIQRIGEPEPLTVPTVRDRIDLVPVESSLIGTDIAYLRLISFQENAARDLEQHLRRHLDQGATAVVLDLRDNPGGLLDQAVAVADLFLQDGPIVTTRGRAEAEHTISATPSGYGPALPLVILVNKGSASASEVVAGALQDTGRATIIGAPTYGKGTVQTLLPTRTGSALKLTIARYYTPSGEPVASHQGRRPDVVVRPSPAPSSKARLRDAILGLDGPSPAQRTELLDLLATLDDPVALPEPFDWNTPPEQRLDHDEPLSAAVSYLRR